jgi:N-acetylmuramoyl-L-alanine amidase
MSARPLALLLSFAALLPAAIACSSQATAPAEPTASAVETTAPLSIVAESLLAPATPPALPPEPSQGALAGRRICIDPGHDGFWTPGAAGRDRAGRLPRHPTGISLNEHELTLAVAERLRPLLEAEGASVCVTRKSAAESGGLQLAPVDLNGDGRVRTRGQAVEDEPERIQPRIDWANQFEADILLSIHFNGLEDRSVHGTEVYFTDGGLRRDDGRRLAAAVLEGLLDELRGAGFTTVDRGIKSDAYQRYSPEETRRLISANAAAIRANGSDPANCPACYRLFTLGNNPMSPRPGRYLGVLVEVEFLSNPDVVETLILRPDSLDLIARGLAEGLYRFYALQ